MTTIAKGTKVRLRTSNGGDTVVQLAADYKPTYGCWFTGFTNAGELNRESFYRAATDIVSVEPTDAEPHSTPIDALIVEACLDEMSPEAQALVHRRPVPA